LYVAKYVDCTNALNKFHSIRIQTFQVHHDGEFGKIKVALCANQSNAKQIGICRENKAIKIMIAISDCNFLYSTEEKRS